MDNEIGQYWGDLVTKSRQEHVIVFTSVFSPDGDYLVCGSSTGRICIWHLETFLSIDSVGQNQRNAFDTPTFSFQAFDGPIYSLVFAGDMLFGGTYAGVGAWSWVDILKSAEERDSARVPKCLGTFDESEVSLRPVEVNGLAVDVERGFLVGASGDNNAYVFDLNSNQCVHTLKGHEAYLHCVLVRKNGQVVTGGEDGTVRLWDVRSNEAPAVIQPKASKHGRWIGCLDVDDGDNWMVCGGGSRSLSLWHLASLTQTATMPADAAVQTTIFSGDTVISAGVETDLYHWSNSLELKSRVPSSSSSVFAVAVNDQQPRNRVLVSSGNSRAVDVYASFFNRAFSFTFR